MSQLRRVLIAGVAVVAILSTESPTVMAQTHTVYNTTYPSVIRVAIRAYNNPVGPILYVQTLGFEEYCRDVLPNEWYPSWSPESLKAGAIAVKMFGWYHTLHPVTVDGFTFDVDNTTNFQYFKYLSGTVKTNQALQDTWNIVYVPPSGEIKELEYRAGIPNNENPWFLGTDIMSQWGSQYWGHIAKLPSQHILNLYYPLHAVRRSP